MVTVHLGGGEGHAAQRAGDRRVRGEPRPGAAAGPGERLRRAVRAGAERARPARHRHGAEPSGCARPGWRRRPWRSSARLHSTTELGDSTMVLGRVRSFSIADDVLVDSHPEFTLLEPLTRLGRDEWALHPEVRSVRRPVGPRTSAASPAQVREQSAKSAPASNSSGMLLAQDRVGGVVADLLVARSHRPRRPTRRTSSAARPRRARRPGGLLSVAVSTPTPPSLGADRGHRGRPAVGRDERQQRAAVLR